MNAPAVEPGSPLAAETSHPGMTGWGEGAQGKSEPIGWCLVDGKHIARTLFPTRELAQARADRWNAHDGYAFVVCALVPDGAR